jgi:hypothetical protein
MSEIKKVEERLTEITDDIICDICGESCSQHEYIVDNPVRLDHGKPHKVFEYLTLKSKWGFYSDKDEQYWEAHVCEKCVDKHLSPLIKFKKHHYNFATGNIEKHKPIEEKA